jgi:hypothetical protein
LIPKSQVNEILRKGTLIRNKTRRVSFLDQQPGGGNRMDLDRASDHDSAPTRPRRSFLTLNCSKTKFISSEGTPKNIVRILAATKLQAMARGWMQWKKTRLCLLQARLNRIEDTKRGELRKVEEEKWKKIAAVKTEMTEAEQQLQSQLPLSTKLVNHLKEEEEMFRNDTEKVREFCQILYRNNDVLDQTNRFNLESCSAIKRSVDLMQEKNTLLLKSSEKYASKVSRINEEIFDIQFSIAIDSIERKMLQNAARRIRDKIVSRSHDEALISSIDELVCDVFKRREMPISSASFSSASFHEQEQDCDSNCSFAVGAHCPSDNSSCTSEDPEHEWFRNRVRFQARNSFVVLLIP